MLLTNGVISNLPAKVTWDIRRVPPLLYRDWSKWRQTSPCPAVRYWVGLTSKLEPGSQLQNWELRSLLPNTTPNQKEIRLESWSFENLLYTYCVGFEPKDISLSFPPLVNQCLPTTSEPCPCGTSLQSNCSHFLGDQGPAIAAILRDFHIQFSMPRQSLHGARRSCPSEVLWKNRAHDPNLGLPM